MAASPGFDDLPDPSRTRMLIRGARAGDGEALDRLLAQHQDRLLRIVRVYLGGDLRNHLESMDIVQAANEVVMREIEDLRSEDPGRWLRWLTMVAINQIRAAHDYHRAGRRDVARQQPIAAERLTESSAAVHELSAHQTAPGERAAKNEARRLLDEAVTALPEDARQAVVLRDYCGLEFRAIAEEMGRSDGAVRMLHARAWDKLRDGLMPRLRPGDAGPLAYTPPRP